jgi:selenocysteine lyase/cysteine desulfurase
MLSETADVEVTYVRCDRQGFVSPDDIKAAIRPDTRLVAVNHASNVTGAIQPIDEIGLVVRQTNALFLVDAAQSLGHVPLDVRMSYADLLAAPGHKGLLGPLGTGILYIRSGIESEVQPLRYGGTGTQSDEDRQPNVLPQKYEPGNHNLVGLAGLAAATAFLKDETIKSIHAHHSSLVRQLIDELSEIEGVTIYGPKLAADRTSVVSITVEGYEPQELAAILDSTYRIQTRAGFQCAPRMHEALGTVRGGGTLRFSPGFATTSEEINRAVAALQEMAAIAIK